MERDYYIGVMTGTSVDGIDAVLADFTGNRFQRLVFHHHLGYPKPVRDALLELALEMPAIKPATWLDLDIEVAEVSSLCINQLLRKADLEARKVRAIGFHGQTVFHRPAGPRPGTLQLGDPNRIASACHIAVVADFRRRDLAEGGQGAPLVPAFHHAIFADPTERRCVVNIGGIANITVLPNLQEDYVTGYDTGPGNALMDEWNAQNVGTPFDADGQWAASGSLHLELLESLASDPYFQAATPKSTGRDYFNLAWARRRFDRLSALSAVDVQRTLCELTAMTIARAAKQEGAQRLLICGGGSDNGFLIARLRSLFSEGPVELTDVQKFPHAQVEAAAFAWLAMRTLSGESGNLPSVTGARRAVTLGGIYQP